MAIWSPTQITDIFEGTNANDGTGDTIRDAFLKVDQNFQNISSYLSGGSGSGGLVSFLYANSETFSSNIGSFTNFSSANLLATVVNITGNLNSGNIVANVGLYSSGTTNLTGNTNVQTVNLLGNMNVTGAILPTVTGIDIGSPTRPFGNIYATPVTSAIILPSVSSGYVSVHTEYNPSSYVVKDVGVVGKYYKGAGNLYAFFGYQASTDNLVYKQSATDHTASGESEFTTGVYGNAQLGSLFLSNTVSTSANTLIANGDTSLRGNVFVSGNIYSGSNLVVTSATILNMIVTGNVQGNLQVSGTLFSNGSELLSVNTAGPYNLFSGGIVLGNVLFPATFDAVSQTSAAFVVGGGIGAGGNVNAAGFIGPVYGTILNSSQPYITEVGTLGNLTVTYTTTTNRLNVQNIGTTDITVTGNLYTQAGTITGITSLNVSGNLRAGAVAAATIGNVGASIIGTITTASQPNITSLGTLTSLTTSGNITGQNSLSVTNKVTAANLQVTGNTVLGNVVAGNLIPLAGNIYTLGSRTAWWKDIWLNAGTIYLGGTAIGVDATGNLNANVNGTLYGNIIGTTAQFSTLTVTQNTNLLGIATLNGVGIATLGGSASFSSINGTPIGNVTPSSAAFTTVTMSANTASVSTIYARGVYDNSTRVVSVSTGLGNLSISNGNINLYQFATGFIGGSATSIPTVTTDLFGRVSGITTNTVATSFGIQGTSGVGSVSSSGVANGVLAFTGSFGVTAAATVANAQSTTVNISTPQDLRTTAIPTFSGVLPSANVTSNLGSAALWWNIIYGRSVQAQYADLAENYASDADYAAGTVVVFGGDKEITVSDIHADPRVAGVISTEPAYLMNSTAKGLPVALRGRVPCHVVGPVHKGDLLVTANIQGFAVSVGNDRSYGACVFAKSLTTDLSEGLKTITAVIL